jgi:uncharacterized protein (DUF1330 family)
MSHVDFSKEVFAEFRAGTRIGPIHMLNLIRLNPRANYPDGRSTTGAEAYAAYGRESEPVFSRLSGKIVWRGHFDQLLIGPPTEAWDICFIAQYPSTEALVEMIKDRVYRSAMLHRQAAVADSRLVCFTPEALGVGFDGTAR